MPLARTVYDNLLRSGPDRRSQESARHVDTTGVSLATPTGEGTIPIQWKEQLQTIRASLLPVLSPVESRALELLLAGVSMKEIARRQRCSPKADPVSIPSGGLRCTWGVALNTPEPKGVVGIHGLPGFGKVVHNHHRQTGPTCMGYTGTTGTDGWRLRTMIYSIETIDGREAEKQTVLPHEEGSPETALTVQLSDLIAFSAALGRL